MAVAALPPARHALEAEWLLLTRERLPRLAAEKAWPISADHCFQRVLLDAACGSPWYRAIAGRPAYRAASDAQLTEAVRLARAVADGNIDLSRLNRESLAGRGYRGRAR